MWIQTSFTLYNKQKYTIIQWAWIGLLFTVTDILTTCVVAIFRVEVSCIISLDGIKLWFHFLLTKWPLGSKYSAEIHQSPAFKHGHKIIISPHFWDDSLCHCLIIWGLTKIILLPAVATRQKLGRQISGRSAKRGIYCTWYSTHTLYFRRRCRVV